MNPLKACFCQCPGGSCAVWSVPEDPLLPARRSKPGGCELPGHSGNNILPQRAHSFLQLPQGEDGQLQPPASQQQEKEEEDEEEQAQDHLVARC